VIVFGSKRLAATDARDLAAALDVPQLGFATDGSSADRPSQLSDR
jgi:hypothetical protein